MRFFICFFLLFQANAYAQLNVVTTTTNLAWLVKEIGGDKVKVEPLLNGLSDAHYADANPSFVRKVSNADIVCQNGLGLEVGWLPKVLSKSGNAKVQPGGSGYCDAGKSVTVLEKPKGDVDRSMGDVHPEGNPHFCLGPKSLLQAADAVLGALSANDSANADYYLKNYEKLNTKLTSISKEVATILAPLQDKKLMEYHKEFSYFFRDYNLSSVGAIETVPGVPPSAGQLVKSAQKAKSEGVVLAVASSFAPQNVLQQFAQFAKIPTVQVPIYISPHSDIKNYRDLQIRIAKKLVAQ